MSREATFQDRLKRLLEDVGSEYRFDGLEIAKVERDYPVGRKKADIAVFLRGEVPFLFIETKKKVERPGRWKKRGLFRPLDVGVVGQAISYVAIYEDIYKFLVPFFATATPDSLAVFRTPTNIKHFVDLDKAYEGDYEHAIKSGKYSELIKGCLMLSRDYRLREVHVQKLLDGLAKDYLKKELLKAEPTWALIGYFRSFVDGFADACKDLLKLRMKRDPVLKAELARMEKRVGYIPDHTSLAKMMAYVLMNKIIFYKVLEEKYKLRKMGALDTTSSTRFTKQLKRHFDEAIEATGDFEPVFRTGIYDLLSVPDDPSVMEYLNDFIITLDNIKVVEIGDLTGYIYEELIPDEERHRLGQFYTPPAIAELITKWAIRRQDDVVLDPAVGSGGFQLWAYRVLLKLKTGKDVLPAPRRVHERLLKQLYSIDINPFPAHLTAVSLSMRNVRAPSTNVNVIVDDFFNTKPNKTYFAKVTTPRGEFTRAITLPSNVDVVIGNPPYTRWVEIPEKTQKSINNSIGDLLKKHKLSRGIGKEIGIYVHFIMHAHDFLKKNGRLGMIVSSSWLQSDYGVDFVNFLFDHFKVKAIIDFSKRLFRIPLIATCVILIEKEKNKKARSENTTVSVYVDKKSRVEEILDALATPEKWKDKFLINVVKQGKIPRDEKIIKTMFGASAIEEIVRDSTATTEMQHFFNVRYGNLGGVFSRGGTGGNAFFYLSEEDVEKRKLREFVNPLISSSRYSRFFTFKKSDWKELQEEGKICCVFTAHKPRDRLPENVKAYVTDGESSIKTRVGKTCNQSLSSLMREKSEEFYGWYDLGEVLHAPICATRYSQYMHRFTRLEIPIAIDDDLIALIPKEELNEMEIKAILAYLNSDITRFLIETRGRTTAGGMTVFEPNFGKTLPILDVRGLTKRRLEELAQIFDRLEEEARDLGGADAQENIEKLQVVIDDMDAKISGIIGLEADLLARIKKIVRILSERRISRTQRAKPETIKGDREPRITPPKRRKKKKKEEPSEPLTRWIK